ncbi:hypothetical protein HN695_00100 [Candidatus Woesearchaeota archaeon]|jgi:MtN3 and saliva related transmembrane protein|nr:hypothetical protein [Candidatus Woesearchaeota archaeon]MBT5272865.1 hypothetical protein [Candidatus Woesearchaeota archaeon]MBT6041331.1 hypothetical protein [Candidatus Woesearchaeota archaeon]MBT6336411.1 hypothetical protein [Candidatus Woesearchaeota archaeon]MBT7926714.1 hypothetical protein [Candidatus Woesearchaeota archaeon]
MITEIIGYSAAVVGTSLMLPQVIKSIKTKSVGDLSYVMVIVYVINCILWLTYGILLNAWPMILCNALALIISFIQLGLKIRYSDSTT